MGIFSKKKHMLILFCSPNEHKSTRMLLNAFIEPFKDSEEWETEEMNVFEMKAHPCIACGECKIEEKCRFRDLNAFDKAFRKSDALVIASPIYNLSFPAPFKAILDRTQRYYEARFSLELNPPIEKHRAAVLLATSGSQEDFGYGVMIKQLEKAFTVMNTSLRGSVLWGNTDTDNVNLGEALEKAHVLALELTSEA